MRPFQEIPVQLTNISSIKSKSAMEGAGYLAYSQKNAFRYNRLLSGKIAHRSALINRGYYLRVHAVIGHIRSFLETHSTSPAQIVSLGCGFDTTFDSLVNSAEFSFSFFEVDFPAVLSSKDRLIGKSEFSNLVRVPADLRNRHELPKSLASGGLNPELPTLFVAECVLTYIPVEETDELLRVLSSTYGLASFLILEQIAPFGTGHPFCQRMERHFESIGTPIHALRKYQTLQHQIRRFSDSGFTKAISCCSLLEYWDAVCDNERRRVQELEQFDEYEDWHLFLSHYFIGLFTSAEVKEPTICSKILAGTATCILEPTGSLVCSISHTAIPLADGNFLFSGGFGALPSGSRGRLPGSWTMRPPLSQVGPLCPEERLYATFVPYADGGLLFGGRMGPRKVHSELWRFSQRSGWRKLPQDGSPPGRFRHASWCHYNKLWIFGGIDEFGAVLSDLWVFDLIFERWQSVPVLFCPDLIARHSAASCITFMHRKPHAIVFGGLSREHRLLGDFLIFPLLEGAFVPASLEIFPNYVPCISLLEPRHSHRIVPLRDASCNEAFLAVIGGVSPSGAPIQLVPFATFPNCKPIESIYLPSTSMPSLVNNSLVVRGGEMFSLGGGFTCFSMGSVFDPSFKISLFRQGQQLLPILHSDPSWQIREASLGDLTPAMWSEIYEKREPVLFKGNDSRPLVKNRWTRAFLENSVPCDYLVSSHRSLSNILDFTKRNFSFFVCTWKQFVSSIYELEPEAFFYLRSIGENPRKQPSDIWKSFPQLAEALSLPADLIPQISPNHSSYFSSVLRISSPTLQLWTHYDVMDNILFQLAGSKTVTLWKPSDLPYLGIKDSSSKYVDYASIRDRDHPFFSSNPCRFQLEEGDFLFIPSLVFHHVAASNQEPSVAVNVFWRHLPESHYERKDLYGNRDLAAANKASEIIESGHRLLDSLPESGGYRSFYRAKFTASQGEPKALETGES